MLCRNASMLMLVINKMSGEGSYSHQKRGVEYLICAMIQSLPYHRLGPCIDSNEHGLFI